MAAPIVAGEAALVRAAFPNLRQDKVIDRIERTAKRIDSPVRARIDVGAALTTVLDDGAVIPRKGRGIFGRRRYR